MAEDKTVPETEEKPSADEIMARLTGEQRKEEAEQKKEPPEAHKADTTFIEVPEPEEDKEELEKVVAQADKPDAVRNAIQRHQQAAKEARERAEAAEAKVKDFEDRDKSEQQKQEEKAEADRQRADQAEAQLLRMQVATAKQLPVSLAERLQGSNQKELEQDADRLLELVKPSVPSGDVGAGKGQPAKEENFNDELRRRAGITPT